MSFTVLLLVLFCGLTSAQTAVPTTAVTNEAQSCSPVLCEFLTEFGAMKEKQRAMEAKLKETENQILELKNKEATKVAFSAAIGGSEPVGPYNYYDLLIFDLVFTNVGDAYNKFNGIFRAPVAGLYYFSIFFHGGGQHRAGLHLYKHGSLVLVACDSASSSDPFDSGGNSVVLQLRQGEDVFVRLGKNTQVQGSNYYTTFSGFLITQM